ncbi:MAG: DUF6498-containing protein [Pseudomonadota bacterium]
MAAVPDSSAPTIAAPTGVLPSWASQGGVLIANALFFLLIVFERMSAYDLLFVFWIELAIIGLFALLQLAVAALIGYPFDSRYSEASRGGTLVLSVMAGGFFITKFGAVLLGLFLILITLAGEAGWRDFAPNDLGPWVTISFWVLLASHAIAFVTRYLFGRGYRDIGVISLLLYPYVRGLWIVGAIFAAVVVTALYDDEVNTLVFAVVVLLVKTLFDVLCLALSSRKR